MGGTSGRAIVLDDVKHVGDTGTVVVLGGLAVERDEVEDDRGERGQELDDEAVDGRHVVREDVLLLERVQREVRDAVLIALLNDLEAEHLRHVRRGLVVVKGRVGDVLDLGRGAGETLAGGVLVGEAVDVELDQNVVIICHGGVLDLVGACARARENRASAVSIFRVRVLSLGSFWFH